MENVKCKTDVRRNSPAVEQGIMSWPCLIRNTLVVISGPTCVHVWLTLCGMRAASHGRGMVTLWGRDPGCPRRPGLHSPSSSSHSGPGALVLRFVISPLCFILLSSSAFCSFFSTHQCWVLPHIVLGCKFTKTFFIPLPFPLSSLVRLEESLSFDTSGNKQKGSH